MIQYDAAHPGEIVRVQMGEDISVTQLADHLGVTRTTMSRLINGASGMSADMAMKLAQAFPHTDAQFWLTLQLNYDLSRAQREKRKQILPVRAA